MMERSAYEPSRFYSIMSLVAFDLWKSRQRTLGMTKPHPGVVKFPA